MRNSVIGVAFLGLLAAACGGRSTPATAPSSTMPATGTWAGTSTDSTTPALGNGGMMGQAGMGTMTLQLVQNGSTVTGTVRFSGMASNMMGGTFAGTMSSEDMTFTMNLPPGSMMSGSCSAQTNGTARMNTTAMTMAGTYSGNSSCTGAFNNGQMTLSRR
jgi:hypothetical protein